MLLALALLRIFISFLIIIFIIFYWAKIGLLDII